MSLENFFTLVKDGSWHNIEELSNKLDLPQDKLIELSRFLSENGLVKYDEQGNKTRLEPKWRLLLPEDEENHTEPKTTLATLIIPPDTCVEVQSMQIRNLSSIEIEVSLRVNDKIRELAIKI